MSVYHWKGIAAGEHTEGDIEANNSEEAKAELRSQKIMFTDLQLVSGNENSPQDAVEEAEEKSDKLKKYKAKNIKNRELMVFTKKFGTMVESGLPILKALKMLTDQTEDKNFKMVLNLIYMDVESGTTLSDAFEKHPAVFDAVYINLLRAGESSGKLTVFLKKLVIQIEKSEKIRAKVKSALTYPTILVIVAVVVIVLMLVKVVPVFEQMFSSMGHSLPGPTMMIISMSEFLRDPSGGGVLFAVVMSIILGIRYSVKKNLNFRRRFHKFLLKLPLIRDVIQKSTLSRIAMIQGNLSAAGVSVLDSLEIVSKAIKNEVYKDAVQDIKKGISEGSPLSQLYTKHENIFSPTFCQMMEVGEETGKMDEMFDTTARYFEEEFDMVVDRLTELLEPLMIVFMGLTIGFIIVAMYMPIFEIGHTMSAN